VFANCNITLVDFATFRAINLKIFHGSYRVDALVFQGALHRQPYSLAIFRIGWF
jgi:hypothetical protein